MKQIICDNSENENIKINTVILKQTCRYHPIKDQNYEYDLNSIVPSGLCLDAFHTAYPFCLALLYNAEFNKKNKSICKHLNRTLKRIDKDRVFIQCPKSGILMEIHRYCTLPKIIKHFKTLIEKAFKKIYPLDIVDYKIRIKIVEVKKNCPKKYKVGEEFWFNIRDPSKLCPASFDAIYPSLHLIRNNIKVPWSNKKSSCYVHCPDRNGMVYEISKDRYEKITK